MRNQKTLDIVFLSMLMSIIIVMSYVPNLGFITIGAISITFVHIPVIIAAIFLNRRMGMLAGAVFGISSMVLAYTRSIETPISIDYLFRDPSIAIVPRVIFPYLTALLYENLKNYIKFDYFNVFISSFAGSIIHSFLVMTTLYFFFNNVTYLQNATIISINENIFTKNILGFVVGVFIGSILKSIIVAFITTPIIMALKTTSKKVIDNNVNELHLDL